MFCDVKFSLFPIYSIFYLLVHGHYHERPLRYGPLIPHLKTLFHKFCEIRNNQELTREAADELIDKIILNEGSEQLQWAYKSFKIERKRRNKRFWKWHTKWLKKMSDEAFQVDAEIQKVRQNTNLSYAEECRQANAIKARAADHVRQEMGVRIEDCREFTRLRPQLTKNRCYAKWREFPIYYGVSKPQ